MMNDGTCLAGMTPRGSWTACEFCLTSTVVGWPQLYIQFTITLLRHEVELNLFLLGLHSGIISRTSSPLIKQKYKQDLFFSQVE